jgi:hypothetical protein
MAGTLSDVTGSAALACVGGTALALLVTAAGFYLRIRMLRGQAAALRASRGAEPTAAPGGSPYRDGAEVVAPDPQVEALESRAAALGFQLFAVLFTVVVTQPFYLFFWIDVVRRLLGGNVELGIDFDLFFWVALVSGSVILGAVASAWEERL